MPTDLYRIERLVERSFLWIPQYYISQVNPNSTQQTNATIPQNAAPRFPCYCLHRAGRRKVQRGKMRRSFEEEKKFISREDGQRCRIDPGFVANMNVRTLIFAWMLRCLHTSILEASVFCYVRRGTMISLLPLSITGMSTREFDSQVSGVAPLGRFSDLA